LSIRRRASVCFPTAWRLTTWRLTK
jgi:hypothetical protein